MSISSIKEAIRKVQSAKDRLSAEVAKTFPVGSEIHWDKHGHRQHGTVRHHGNTGRVRIENERTGKSYWIGMFDVVGYVENRSMTHETQKD